MNALKIPQTVLLWSFLGILALIFISGVNHGAITVIPIYGFCLIMTLITVKLPNPDKVFRDLFLTLWTTYCLLVFADYLYIIKVVNPGMLEETAWGHLWRLLAMVALGAGIALLLTFLSTLNKQPVARQEV